MLSVTRLLLGLPTPGDSLRYGPARHRRPVVVWNLTRRCNLHCLHCYAEARERTEGELDTAQGKALLDDLASYGVPVVLFSGGEPTLREDLLELVAYATERGIKAVISTNGTLITRELASSLKKAGASYVGVSLDGLEEGHDRFRGKTGAFREAVRGLGYIREAGIRTGVRFTITRFNAPQVPAIFDLVRDEGIDRLCFYHLVYSGRGSKLQEWDLGPAETRVLMDLIFQRTRELNRNGVREVMTVDNHADSVYLYLSLRKGDPGRAEEIYGELLRNGGNSSGVGIGAIDEKGGVHPDQFWRHYSLGNVKERPFSQIWGDTSQPLLQGLRERRKHLTGRCGLCRYQELCGGNFRVRAEAVHGDIWAPDPACYLSDQEIGLA